jgi:hypothetical protein
MSESGYGYDPQFDADRTQGYDDRWHGAQYRPDASDGWKAGWREADYELSGNEDAEFLEKVANDLETYCFATLSRAARTTASAW